MTTWYLFIAFIINLVVFKSTVFFNPLIQESWSSLGSVLPLLSVWALRLKIVFLLISIAGPVLMVLSILNKLSDKILINLVCVIFIIDIICLLVLAFGYSMPFISYEPHIN